MNVVLVELSATKPVPSLTFLFAKRLLNRLVGRKIRNIEVGVNIKNQWPAN